MDLDAPFTKEFRWTDPDYTLYTVREQPKVMWEYSLCGDFTKFVISVETAPNWFHRLMQRLILGVKWRKAKQWNQVKT